MQFVDRTGKLYESADRVRKYHTIDGVRYPENMIKEALKIYKIVREIKS